jgi:hypothetical protein
VDAAEIIERRVGLCPKASAFAGVDDFVEIIDNERRMCTLRRVKIGLNSEMKIHRACDEPDATASCHCRRFRDVRKLENSPCRTPVSAFRHPQESRAARDRD